ncbi:hypothetical protein [Desulfopila sp. IMCC35008]|uniref:hypothetical protein n=1 Tax=Desulfopila sp. IMCC35008 TaxID=2653858 RepID=UPI0013CFE5A6|nr:hypothetical protein [Desulfopila sp. IMCC35008]
MDNTSIKMLLEDLCSMAAELLTLNAEKLQIRKSELDAYVDAVTEKMSGPSKHIAGREFEKCRVYAREWIKVYSDTTFDDTLKNDILKEDAAEFFFTVDERIIGVQKKFFLLGMQEEVMSPSEPFSPKQREAIIAKTKIRMLARAQNLKPTSKTKPATSADHADTERLWYFGDRQNLLQSSEAGLSDREALNYLLGSSN